MEETTSRAIGSLGGSAATGDTSMSKVVLGWLKYSTCQEEGGVKITTLTNLGLVLVRRTFCHINVSLDNNKFLSFFGF